MNLPGYGIAERESRSAMSAVELQGRLRELSGLNVLLMITDNTTSMLSARHEDGGVVVLRAHKMFLSAPEDVLKSLAAFLGGRSSRRDLVQEYIDANMHLIRPKDETGRDPVIHTKGKYHDLLAIKDYVNDTYLSGRSEAPVTWGRKVSRRAVRSVRLGCFDPVKSVITISRRLDRSDIPRYMVEYVMFHEMLHEVLGIGERADGKRDIHGSTFKLMEQTFPDYERAKLFEKKKWGGG